MYDRKPQNSVKQLPSIEIQKKKKEKTFHQIILKNDKQKETFKKSFHHA